MANWFQKWLFKMFPPPNTEPCTWLVRVTFTRRNKLGQWEQGIREHQCYVVTEEQAINEVRPLLIVNEPTAKNVKYSTKRI